MQRHAAELMQALSGDVRFTHAVASRDHRGGCVRGRRFPVIRTSSLNLDGSLALSPGLFLASHRVQRRRPVDIVHLHFPDPMSHIASLAVSPSIPRVITWHADIQRQKVLLKLYRPLLKRSLASASAVIAPTPAHVSSSAFLSPMAASPKLRQIPFGFNLARYARPDEAKVTEVAQRYPGRRIFALGRHVSYKGFDVLIRAMALTRPDTRLLLGGGGPLTPDLVQLARSEGVGDRVDFLGYLPESDLPAYYHACEIFCLPSTSRAEAFGIVQVEAMASGLPVISTRLGTGVEVVNRNEETGVTVPPGDVGALASAINLLLADQSLREIYGQNARAQAMAAYSPETMKRETLALYRELAARSKR